MLAADGSWPGPGWLEHGGGWDDMTWGSRTLVIYSSRVLPSASANSTLTLQPARNGQLSASGFTQ